MLWDASSTPEPAGLLRQSRQPSRAGRGCLSSFRVYLRWFAAGYGSLVDLKQEKFPSPKTR
jgi:hypothetical protein